MKDIAESFMKFDDSDDSDDMGDDGQFGASTGLADRDAVDKVAGQSIQTGLTGVDPPKPPLQPRDAVETRVITEAKKEERRKIAKAQDTGTETPKKLRPGRSQAELEEISKQQALKMQKARIRIRKMQKKGASKRVIKKPKPFMKKRTVRDSVDFEAEKPGATTSDGWTGRKEKYDVAALPSEDDCAVVDSDCDYGEEDAIADELSSSDGLDSAEEGDDMAMDGEEDDTALCETCNRVLLNKDMLDSETCKRCMALSSGLSPTKGGGLAQIGMAEDEDDSEAADKVDDIEHSSDEEDEPVDDDSASFLFSARTVGCDWTTLIDQDTVQPAKQRAMFEVVNEVDESNIVVSDVLMGVANTSPMAAKTAALREFWGNIDPAVIIQGRRVEYVDEEARENLGKFHRAGVLVRESDKEDEVFYVMNQKATNLVAKVFLSAVEDKTEIIREAHSIVSDPSLSVSGSSNMPVVVALAIAKADNLKSKSATVDGASSSSRSRPAPKAVGSKVAATSIAKTDTKNMKQATIMDMKKKKKKATKRKEPSKSEEKKPEAKKQRPSPEAPKKQKRTKATSLAAKASVVSSGPAETLMDFTMQNGAYEVPEAHPYARIMSAVRHAHSKASKITNMKKQVFEKILEKIAKELEDSWKKHSKAKDQNAALSLAIQDVFVRNQASAKNPMLYMMIFSVLFDVANHQNFFDMFKVPIVKATDSDGQDTDDFMDMLGDDLMD